MNKQHTRNKRLGVGFSFAGSIITILFFAYINFTVGGRFPWFIFPSYAILWWPLAVIIGRYSWRYFSLAGSLTTIALLVTVNYLTSWDFPWFLFPSFAILWWPFTMFWGKKHKKTLSLIGSAVVIISALVTNFLTFQSGIWFQYIVFAILWWPLKLFFPGPRMMRSYSAVGSLLLLVFLSFENFFRSPEVPWALVTYYPVILWPITVFLKKHLGKLSVVLLISLTGIVYYILLNIYVFRGFSWAIYPAFALLWWPLSAAAPKRKKALYLSFTGSALTAALFIATNFLASPGTIWAVYPIFGLVWWPLSVYYFAYRFHKINMVE